VQTEQRTELSYLTKPLMDQISDRYTVIPGRLAGIAGRRAGEAGRTAEITGRRAVAAARPEKITNCSQMWATDICSSPRGKAETIGFDDVVYILLYRYSTGDLLLVIMPAKQEIVAEVKVLFPTVTVDYVRESSA
jgi:hypothetical protein